MCGCVSSRQFVGERAFDFQTDTFAYANELVWDYYFDGDGQWIHERHSPKPDYTHHCFVVVRSARQFFQHARFDPRKAKLNPEEYRKRVKRIVSIDPAHALPQDQRIVIPGYANLREFSAAHESLLKAECGRAWRSYFQRGHWRIIFPFSARHQHRTAEAFLTNLGLNKPPIAHLVRFPQLTINHAVLVFAARETPQEIEFLVYDPNQPNIPKTLRFDRSTRSFHFAGNDYWPGGEVDVYEIYQNWRY